VLRPFEASSQSSEVRIHRDTRDCERVSEDHIGGLSTNPRQRHQILEVRRDIPAKLIAQALRHRLQRRRLLSEETRGRDAYFQRLP
jgi:hypothetical protein